MPSCHNELIQARNSRMGEEILFQLLATSDQVGIRTQPMPKRLDPLLDRSTHLVFRVVTHVDEEPPQTVVHLGEDAFVDGLGYPPW